MFGRRKVVFQLTKVLFFGNLIIILFVWSKWRLLILFKTAIRLLFFYRSKIIFSSVLNGCYWTTKIWLLLGRRIRIILTINLFYFGIFLLKFSNIVKHFLVFQIHLKFKLLEIKLTPFKKTVIIFLLSRLWCQFLLLFLLKL